MIKITRAIEVTLQIFKVSPCTSVVRISWNGGNSSFSNADTSVGLALHPTRMDKLMASNR